MCPAPNEEYNVEHIAQTFVQRYYTVLSTQPNDLHRFYGEDSSFCHYDPKIDKESLNVVGQTQINEQVQRKNYLNSHTKVVRIAAQRLRDVGILVQVTGFFNKQHEGFRQFTQSVVLVSPGQSRWYVQNDMLAFLEEDDLITTRVEMAAAAAKATASDDGGAEKTTDNKTAAMDETANTATTVDSNDANTGPPTGPGVPVNGAHQHDAANAVESSRQTPVAHATTEWAYDSRGECYSRPKQHDPAVAVVDYAAAEYSVDNENISAKTDGQVNSMEAYNEQTGAEPTATTAPASAPERPTAVVKGRPSRESAGRASAPLRRHPADLPSAEGGGSVDAAGSAGGEPLPRDRRRNDGQQAPPAKPCSFAAAVGGDSPTKRPAPAEPSPATPATFKSETQERRGPPQPMSGPAAAAGGRIRSDVFVGNLPDSMSNEELAGLMQEFGRVVNVSIRPGRGSKFAFVTFDDASSAEKAIRKEDITLSGGRAIHIEKRKPAGALGGGVGIGGGIGRPGGQPWTAPIRRSTAVGPNARRFRPPPAGHQPVSSATR